MRALINPFEVPSQEEAPAWKKRRKPQQSWIQRLVKVLRWKAHLSGYEAHEEENNRALAQDMFLNRLP